MRPACILFGIALMVMTYTAVASAQTVFSVTKISETEYIKAANECSRYNINVIYKFEFYKNTQYNGETIFCQEDSNLSPIFWHDNNMLYLKTYDHQLQGYVYLKIKVQQTIREILENAMPNEAIRPALKR